MALRLFRWRGKVWEGRQITRIMEKFSWCISAQTIRVGDTNRKDNLFGSVIATELDILNPGTVRTRLSWGEGRTWSLAHTRNQSPPQFRCCTQRSEKQFLNLADGGGWRVNKKVHVHGPAVDKRTEQKRWRLSLKIYLLCARLHCNHFAFVNSFSLPDNSMKQEILLSLLSRWRNWAWSNFPRITQPGSGRGRNKNPSPCSEPLHPIRRELGGG